MYKGFYGLKESPFNVKSDSRYLSPTKQIEHALPGLLYVIQRRSAKLDVSGPGRDPTSYKPGDVDGKAAADCVVRTPATGRKIKTSRIAAIAPTHHLALQDATAIS